MPDSVNELAARLKERCATYLNACHVARGQVTVEVPGHALIDICRLLRDDPQFSFEQLSDLCGVDYSTYGQVDWQTNDATTSGFSRGVAPAAFEEVADKRPRFAVVYHLLSLKNNQRLRLRVFAEGEPPTVESVVDVWASANWFEREAFDLFGILFNGHPDLRRILTDYGFVGHPFRKDFPLEGKVEVRYDPDKGRVVYQPVSIENRVLVPRVIRGETRQEMSTASEEPDGA